MFQTTNQYSYHSKTNQLFMIIHYCPVLSLIIHDITDDFPSYKPPFIIDNNQFHEKPGINHHWSPVWTIILHY